MQSESDTNDTSINKEDEGTSVTMVDVLKEQEAFEEDAKAVLGASDDKNCTYNSGYVKRQALYACITCCPDSVAEPSTRAGMCLACSLVCHENHDLVELYTKRNFRCDCGSSKFPNNPCNFTGIKSEPNIQNSYNQNFAGLYCVCHRPYPDPESNDEDEMIQCIICEDWLHSKHLNSKVPLSDQYSEMICQACMSSNDFLNNYMCYNVKAEERENESNMSTEVNDLDKSLSENKTQLDGMDQTDDCSLNKIDTSACLNAGESITQIEQNNQEINSKESLPIDSSSKSDDINDSEITTIEECNKSDKVTVNSDVSSPMNSIEKSSEVAVTNTNESNDMEIQPTEINSLTAETSIEQIESKPVEVVPSDEIKIDSPLENINPPSDNPELLEITPQDEKIDTVNATEAEISSLENIDASIQKIVNKEDKEYTDIVSEDNKDKCAVIENILPSITAEHIEDPIDESNEKSEILPENVQLTEELSDSVKPGEPSAEIHVDESAIIPEMSADNTTKDDPTVINELVPGNNSAVKKFTNMDTNEDVSLVENSTDVEKNMSPITETIESNLTENNLEPVPSIDNDTPAPEITVSLPIPTNECIKEDISPITDVSTVPPAPEVEIAPNVSDNKEIAVVRDSDCKVDDASLTPDIVTKLDATTMDVDSMENNSTNLEIESTQESSDAITENVEDSSGTKLDSTAMEVDSMENNSVNLGTESTQESSEAVTEKVEDANNSKSIDKNILENNVLTNPQALSNGETNGEENCTNTCESKKRKLDDETISDNEVVKKKKINNTDVVCIKPSDDQRVQHQGAVFWPSDWRRKLCPCSRCVVTYDENKVSFLLDTEDTVTAYEDLGKIKNSGSSQYEKGLEALSSLGHVQQINAITEYNKMKEKLNEFLTTFKNTNKVVKEEDIKSFFAGMKPKREPDGVYFCH